MRGGSICAACWANEETGYVNDQFACESWAHANMDSFESSALNTVIAIANIYEHKILPPICSYSSYYFAYRMKITSIFIHFVQKHKIHSHTTQFSVFFNQFLFLHFYVKLARTKFFPLFCSWINYSDKNCIHLYSNQQGLLHDYSVHSLKQFHSWFFMFY